jgi:arsenite methyltransferase
MHDHEAKRKSVSEDYARAVTNPASSSCCSPTQKGVAAKLAGYSDEEVAALPVEAVVNSFGCGNPIAFSEIRPGEVVLDLGSGAGIDLLLAAKKVGSSGRVIGVDMTDEMIAKARENISAAGLSNVDVRKGIIEELPVESGSVDWVISNCVINLSPEKSRVFAEITRVLKPGGRMLVSDIVAEGLPAEILGNRRLYSSCLAGAINEAEYLEGLRSAGLADVSVRDRLVYDAAQIKAFISSELKNAGPEIAEPVSDPASTGSKLKVATSGCCGSGSGRGLDDIAKQWALKLEGRIASVKVHARKPEA